MPAKAGIHDLPPGPEARKQALLFLKKKKQKNFCLLRAEARACQRPQGPKVFCFPWRGAFFSKKKRFLNP
jgi:hypothetical protein